MNKAHEDAAKAAYDKSQTMAKVEIVAWIDRCERAADFACDAGSLIGLRVNEGRIVGLRRRLAERG